MAKNEKDNLNEIDDLIPEENIDKMMEELKEEAVSISNNTDKKTTKTVEKAIEKTMEESTSIKKADVVEKDTIKKFKLFFVSDMDEEATYLHEMSVQGYHFQRKEGICYVFKKSDPSNYYYHIGYYEKDKRDGARYLENYKEAGWDSVYHEKAEFDGVYHYFRTETKDGEEPSIFSDKQSRMSLYKRLLTSWRSFIAMLLISLLFMGFCYYFVSTHPTSLQSLLVTVSLIIILALLLSIVVYLRIYIKISKKLTEFKYQ